MLERSLANAARRHVEAARAYALTDPERSRLYEMLASLAKRLANWERRQAENPLENEEL